MTIQSSSFAPLLIYYNFKTFVHSIFARLYLYMKWSSCNINPTSVKLFHSLEVLKKSWEDHVMPNLKKVVESWLRNSLYPRMFVNRRTPGDRFSPLVAFALAEDDFETYKDLLFELIENAIANQPCYVLRSRILRVRKEDELAIEQAELASSFTCLWA